MIDRKILNINSSEENSTNTIEIRSGSPEDSDKIYKIREYSRFGLESVDDSAVSLVIEDENNQVSKRIIPYYWIRWIEEKE